MNTKTKCRNPWPLAIIVFFILFATFIVGFIVWAMRQSEDLVASNYYENEIRYQQQLDRMNRSQALATLAVVTFDAAQHRIVVTLPATQAPGATGSIQLYRPSDARLDRNLPLALNADGVQHLDAKELRDGLWKVRVTWSVNGQEYFLDQSVTVTSG